MNDPYRRSVGIKQMAIACLSMVLLVIAVASCGAVAFPATQTARLTRRRTQFLSRRQPHDFHKWQ